MFSKVGSEISSHKVGGKLRLKTGANYYYHRDARQRSLLLKKLRSKPTIYVPSFLSIKKEIVMIVMQVKSILDLEVLKAECSWRNIDCNIKCSEINPIYPVGMEQIEDPEQCGTKT